ncbi:MAG: transglycosylase domain-containing protein, partial [Bacteroidetes bacterium]|nr:transglycosylase domain-containing protein [Bacteroidota bacterium]
MSEPQRLITLKAALQQQRMPEYQKIIRWLWRIFYGGLGFLLILFLSINFIAIPSFRELEDPSTARASEVLAADNSVLDRYFIENRVPVDYEALSPHLVNALIATEDSRFRQHTGVDGRAILRVLVRTVLLRDESAGGGSTLTQQLAKMLYSDRDFKGMNKIQKVFALLYRKLREWITAVKLERSYTKEEIIALYLNQVDFINNAVGIHSAAEVYFGKNQSDLNIQEAATLIGMLQNPSLYNPNKYPERCIRRRWVVLSQMRKAGYLSEAQFDALKVSKLDMSKFKKVSFTDGKAPYMCDVLERDIKVLLQAPECRKPNGSEYNIYKDGLKIYTTIDPVYQKHAEEAMAEQMRKLQKRFFEVWKGKDPWTYRTRKTTDEEIKNRKESLWRLVREGDRFQVLWPKYMDAVVNKINKRYNYLLSDNDIERLLAESAKPGTLPKMLADKYISLEQAAAYRKILNSTDWNEAKSQYAALRNAVQKQYELKQKMKVFSWNAPRYEKDTIMSPIDSLKYHRMFLQTGMLAVDPTTSEVKAWVGGINFKHFQFDHIRTDRQVGSTFKPFVYATAIAQQSISPCFPVYDQEVTIPAHYMNFTHIRDWTPHNSTGSYSGEKLTLKEALKKSVNSVSAYLMRLMGSTEPVRGLVNNMGIDSSARRPDGGYRVPKEVSICLGAADLTVMEMTGAYATFANKGMYGKPIVIRKIEDKNGKVLWRSLPDEKVALPPNVNYVMVDMLKYNVAGAPGINTLKSEVGGKTGTTNDFTDGWFMGVTPRLVVGTWVGGED